MGDMTRMSVCAGLYPEALGIQEWPSAALLSPSQSAGARGACRPQGSTFTCVCLGGPGPAAASPALVYKASSLLTLALRCARRCLLCLAESAGTWCGVVSMLAFQQLMQGKATSPQNWRKGAEQWLEHLPPCRPPAQHWASGQ